MHLASRGAMTVPLRVRSKPVPLVIYADVSAQSNLMTLPLCMQAEKPRLKGAALVEHEYDAVSADLVSRYGWLDSWCLKDIERFTLNACCECNCNHCPALSRTHAWVTPFYSCVAPVDGALEL